MPLFRITTKQSKNTNGIRIEKGMSVEVVTSSFMELTPKKQGFYKLSIWMWSGFCKMRKWDNRVCRCSILSLIFVLEFV